MKSTGKKAAGLLAGAVLLASAAYGIGSQTGGGGASAANGDSSSGGAERRGDVIALRDRRPFHRGDLAEKLGVDEDRLATALEELRDERKARTGRRRLSADLAKALGISRERARKALRKLRAKARREHRAARRVFFAALAKELGVEESRVRTVLRDARRAGPGEWPSRAEIARRLGVSEAKLRAALEKVRRHRPGTRRDRMRDGLAADLAKELGLEQKDVEAALSKLREAHVAEHKQRHAKFTRALADKLGIPVAKVRAALPEPRRMRRHGMRHGGPGGPPAMRGDHPRFRDGGRPEFHGAPRRGADGRFRPGAGLPGGPGGPDGPRGGGLNF